MNHIKSISAEALNVAAHRALWRGFWAPGGLELTYSVAAGMNLPSGSRVLDAGAGSGESSAFLSETFGWNMTALDQDEFGLALARDKAKHLGLQIDTVVGDLLTLPFADGTFDGVFSQGTFETFGYRRSEAAREWARVLRSGGAFGLGEATLTRPSTSTHTPTLTTLTDTVVALKSAGIAVTLAELHPDGERLWEEFHAPHRDPSGTCRRPGIQASLDALERERTLLGIGVFIGCKA